VSNPTKAPRISRYAGLFT